MKSFELFVCCVCIATLSSCGAPGPVNHVDFDTEFADTSNFKSTETEYGILQEKPYKDLVQVDKQFLLQESEISSIDSLVKTDADPTEDRKKDYSHTYLFDAEAKFTGADSLLNSQSTTISTKSKDSKCHALNIGTGIQGIIVTYTVKIKYPGGVYYNFNDYKIECEAEVKDILKKLNADKKFVFSYLHIKKDDDKFTNTQNLEIKVTPIAQTAIKRRLFKISPNKLEEALREIDKDIKASRIKNKEEALRVGLQEPATADGKTMIVLDSKLPQLSPLSLKLNAAEKLDLKTWKQGVYDPVSGVIQRAFTPLLLFPYELLLHTFLTPLGAKPDDNGFYLNSFMFKKCNGVYINTLMNGVEVKIEDPITDENQSACFAELKEFLSASGRALKFDYIEALEN